MMITNYQKTTSDLIDKSQPLNPIGGVQSPPINETIENTSVSLSHMEICAGCQIIRITGTCDRCGIYQYCSGLFDDANQFEILGIRRINTNGTSTKSSDVESDS